MTPTEVHLDRYRRVSSSAVASVMFGTCALIVATVPFLGWFAALPLAVIGLVLAIKALRAGLTWHFPIGMSILGALLAIAAFAVLVLMTVLTMKWSTSIPMERGVLHGALPVLAQHMV